MSTNKAGTVLFAAGAVLAFVSVFLGNSLQQELRVLPVDALMRQLDDTSIRFLVFAFGFPLGVGISAVGALTGGGADRGRVWLFVFIVFVIVTAAVFVPLLWARDLSAQFFGIGGYLILLLVLGSVWFWGRYRSLLPQPERVAVDLQGMGYLCFAAAVWNVCGFATMPSFALEPEKMLEMGSQAFAIGQMKTIMALFVLGWIFTLTGLYVATRLRVRDDTQLD